MRFPTTGGFREVPVTWFFTDDLPFLPGGTPYGSINWRGVDEKPPEGIGEVVGAPRRWANGANPDPFCCQDEQERIGGAAVGGHASYWLDAEQLAQGGLDLDGSGAFGTGFAGRGGLLLDGSGAWGTGFAGRGGLLLDGSGAWGTGFAGRGGLLLDGSGAESLGGLLLDGSGEFGPDFSSGGGLLLDGSGTFGGGGGGGQIFNGCSGVPLTLVARVSNTAGCGVIDGLTFNITWNPFAGQYQGNGTQGGVTLAVTLEANIPPTCQLTYGCPFAGFGSAFATRTCAPFTITFTALNAFACCAGTFSVAITET